MKLQMLPQEFALQLLWRPHRKDWSLLRVPGRGGLNLQLSQAVVLTRLQEAVLIRQQQQQQKIQQEQQSQGHCLNLEEAPPHQLLLQQKALGYTLALLAAAAEVLRLHRWWVHLRVSVTTTSSSRSRSLLQQQQQPVRLLLQCSF
jgi:hypothetical protein